MLVTEAGLLLVCETLALLGVVLSLGTRLAAPGVDLAAPGVDLAANGAFRAVAVGAGRHIVSFAYRRTSVWIGGVLTLLGLAGGVGVIAVSRRRR